MQETLYISIYKDRVINLRYLWGHGAIRFTRRLGMMTDYICHQELHPYPLVYPKGRNHEYDITFPFLLKIAAIPTETTTSSPVDGKFLCTKH